MLEKLKFYDSELQVLDAENKTTARMVTQMIYTKKT